jgi:DNA polymerase III subunit epsilon
MTHLGPLLAFDTETTGVDVESDRIVTACTALVGDDAGSGSTALWLTNPGVPIPASATAIHGITDEHARENGDDPAVVTDEVATMLTEAWADGYPVVGFNVAYDLTLLDRELRRHCGTELKIGGPVIDPLVIDRALDPYRRGSRKLGALVEHYKVKHEGTHTADGDALAAARLAWVMLRRLPALAGLSLDELHAFQVAEHARWAAEFAAYLRSQSRTDDLPATAWPLRPYREASAS